MSDWAKDMPVWYITRLMRPVRRFGLYNKEYLINESLMFPRACTLVMGPPVWMPYFDASKCTHKLVLPILSFTKVSGEDADRTLEVACVVPTYGPITDFDKDIRHAAMQTAPRAQRVVKSS